MLEGLDKIEWDKLTHAYGSAEDVPELIRDLADPDEETREEAQHQLYGNLWHQGTVYQATQYAVPFLVELIDAPEVLDKDWILDYLSHLAEGHSYLDVHGPLMQESFGQDTSTEEFQTELQEELSWVKAAHDVVYKYVNNYYRLLDDKNSEQPVRLAVLSLLGVFPEHWGAIVPRVRPYVADDADPVIRANSLKLYGMITPVKNQAIIDEITPFLSEDYDRLTRFSAAKSLAWIAREDIPAPALDILAEALVSDDDFIQHYQDNTNQDSTPADAAGNAFGYVGLDAAEPHIANMIETLRTMNWMKGGSLVATILYLLFGEGKLPTNATVDDLTPLQHQFFKTLAEEEYLGTFKDGHLTTHVNMVELTRYYGAPDSQEKLLKFLGET